MVVEPSLRAVDKAASREEDKSEKNAAFMIIISNIISFYRVSEYCGLLYRLGVLLMFDILSKNH